MQVLTEIPSFKLANVILGKAEPFTLQEVVQDLEKVGVSPNVTFIKKALLRLRDNGILVERGSLFSLDK